MKSFVAYPSALQKILFPQTLQSYSTGAEIPQCELLKKVRSLDGSIVKCGITPGEAFTGFTLFRQVIPANFSQRLVAFEKHQLNSEVSQVQQKALKAKVEVNAVPVDNSHPTMVQKATKVNVDVVPGHVDDAIPDYLIQNPELKIAYLEIDLDDYNATMTSLEFFFPRLVSKGILVLNNYFKKGEDFRAVEDYFHNSRIIMHSYSVNNGPHYVVLN
jgi:hypothetical protein